MGYVIKNRKDYKKTVLLLVWILLIGSKVCQYALLPDKYLYDSNTIMRYMYHTSPYVDKAYRFTAAFFRRINIFHISTLEMWSLIITIVFGGFIYRIIRKNLYRVNWMMFVYLCSSIFLIGLYDFNISKDILQLSIFLIMYLVILQASYKDRYLYIAICALIYFAECFFFRNYYIVSAALFVSLSYIVLMLNSNKLRVKTGFIAMVFIVVILLLSFMLAAKHFMPAEYNDVMYVRSRINYGRESSIDAVTIISNAIEANGNLFLWLVNYLITAVRLLFPFELLFKSIGYAPYIVFQLILSHYFIFSWRKAVAIGDIKYILSLCAFTAFFLTSVMFEPDFGSWLRHESTTFPITILFIRYKEYSVLKVQNVKSVA